MADQLLVAILRDAAIRDDEDMLVARIKVFQTVERLLQRREQHTRPLRLHPPDRPFDVGDVGGVMHRHRPLPRPVEFDDADPVVAVELAHRLPRDLLGKVEAVALHRARAVDHDRQRDAGVDLAILLARDDGQRRAKRGVLIAAGTEGRHAARREQAGAGARHRTGQPLLRRHGKPRSRNVVQHRQRPARRIDCGRIAGLDGKATPDQVLQLPCRARLSLAEVQQA